MKKSTVVANIISVFILIVLLGACSKHDEIISSTTITGDCKLSLYFDHATNETSDFNGYTFSFKAGGVLTATKAATVVNGIWSVNGSKMNIDLGTDILLSKLNSNWLIEENTPVYIKLKDDNVSRDDKLQFVKI